MSKTFTSRPSVASRSRGSTRGTGQQTNSRGVGRGVVPTTSGVRGRGANPSNFGISRPTGRGSAVQPARGSMYGYGAGNRGARGRMNPANMNRPQEEGDETLGAVGGGAGTENREQSMSHQGGYTIVSPNERKRQLISQQAQRETEQYEKYKAANKPQHVSYHGTVGGGQMTEAEARQKLVQSNANAKYKLLEKQRLQREERRRQDELVYEKKKMEGRKKSEENERRALRENDRKKEEMDRIKNNFLDRLEKSTPKDSSNSQPKDSAHSTSAASTRSHDQGSTNEMRPTQKPLEAESDEADHMTLEMNSDLQTLTSMFPQYPASAIAEIYSQNHSLEVTANLLSDS